VQREFLRACSMRLLEEQLDASDVLRLIEDQADRLLAGRAGAPASLTGRQQRGLCRMLRILRRDLYAGRTRQIDPLIGEIISARFRGEVCSMTRLHSGMPSSLSRRQHLTERSSGDVPAVRRKRDRACVRGLARSLL
jgi:hypothetical protein